MIKIFENDKVNKGRQSELDLAKGLAIIFMVLVHVNEVYQLEDIEGGIYNRIVEFVGSPPAAPVFMMLLGVGIIYSRKSTAKNLFNRGIMLIILGYGLNLFRDTIPCFILGKMTGDVSYFQDAWELLWGVDILPFAGLTFIFFAAIKKFDLKNRTVFMIWCVFASLNILLSGVSFNNGVINGFFRLIWGTDDYSWFPFLSWITYPILGYYFGQVLIRCKDKDTFYKNIFVITGSVSIPLWICSYVNNIRFGAFGELYQTEYYQHDIIGSIVLGVFALFWLSICYFINKKLPEVIKKSMARWSKNINLIYCIHWLIIGYSMLMLEELAYMPIAIILISIVIFILTDLICIYINKVELKKKKTL